MSLSSARSLHVQPSPSQSPEVAELVERELRRCLDHAAEGLHFVGPDGTILWANQTELDLLGYSPDEYIGHNIAEFHADAEVIQDILTRLKAGETPGCGRKTGRFGSSRSTRTFCAVTTRSFTRAALRGT
jgi:PAS domain S-box-containing protein